MRYRHVLVLIVFFLVFLIIAALLWLNLLPNLILSVRADLGTLILLVDLVLLMIAGPTVWGWVEWTHRQEMEQARRQERAQAADNRRRFLYSLDHELKNPLTAIRAGLINLAATPDAEARQEILASIEAEILRLSRLAAGLRKLAELETQPRECAPVVMAELLQEAVKRAKGQPEAEGRHLTLSLPQAPWPLPNISAEEDLLFLAVYNLLSNSLKFTRPGDRIEVRAFEDGQRLVVVVADTGLGIPAEESPHVWEELYRGQEARAIPGSGLGLALVRAIINRHGGQITLRSQMEHGTEVRMELPVS